MVQKALALPPLTYNFLPRSVLHQCSKFCPSLVPAPWPYPPYIGTCIDFSLCADYPVGVLHHFI